MGQAKRSLEAVRVRVVGEVSEASIKRGYKAAYFTVKDGGATMPCMMWFNRYDACGVQLEVGMLIELTGRFSLYAPKGRMNFEVFSIAQTGEGVLRRQVAELARKLELEGLMDSQRKRPIPKMPLHIGLVTSPHGKAVHDALRTLRKRWPVAKISFAGVLVEGVSAPREIIGGLKACVNAGCEVILLVRGGGTYEELMPFNDEALARAVAACPVPVVTGIGHEPDNSIADMVADRRASTPTYAAAEVSPDISALFQELEARGRSMAVSQGRRLEYARLLLERLSSRPVFSDPQGLFATDSMTLDMLQGRLARALPACLERDRERLDGHERRLRERGTAFSDAFGHALALRAGRLHDLSPLSVIARGYSIASDDEGHVVKSVSAVAPGDSVRVKVADGSLSCTVESVENAASALNQH